MSSFGKPPFLNTLVSEGVIPSAQFGMKLAEFNSELFLGGVNTDLFEGEFTSVPLTQDVRLPPHFALFSLMVP